MAGRIPGKRIRLRPLIVRKILHPEEGDGFSHTLARPRKGDTHRPKGCSSLRNEEEGGEVSR